MIRKTLTILSLIGLLLSVGLWGASYWKPLYRINGATLWAGAGRGFLTNLEQGRLAPGLEWSHGFQGLETDWRSYYFRSGPLPDSIRGQLGNYWILGIPLWIPTLMFGSVIYFCRPLRFRRRRKRKRLGLCVKCGYDLRGSKDCCPECGRGFLS